MLVVDDDHGARHALSRELARYAAQYAVVVEASPLVALGRLRELAATGGEVAVVLAAARMDELTGVALLSAARELHPAARRGLLLGLGDHSARNAFVKASAIGHVEHYVTKPVQSPDERFHRAVTDLLEGWWRLRPGGFEQFRIVVDERSPRASEIRQVLLRNGHPYGSYRHDSEEGRAVLAGARVASDRLPVLVMADGQVLVDPSNAEIAAALGVTVTPPDEVFDVAIVGAGPAGLAAAVGAGSEGLRCALIEPDAMGGQASTSSLIRNYLGFPQGISGAELAERAAAQAILFGTEIIYGSRAISMRADGDLRVVGLANGYDVKARTVVVATGVSYRRLGVPALEDLVGAGVFYGAATTEAAGLEGERVYVVGGGNSAGQTALHLARYAERVTVLVRSTSLAASMSDYLVTALEHTPNVTVEYGVEITGGGGEGRLERLELRHCPSGELSTVPARALFVLIGAEPCTGWLGEAVPRDRWGYVFTGADVPCSTTGGRLPFETATRGVFAVGDVRHGSVKRIASGVGDGSACIRHVHEYLESATTNQ
jgi:thioredoxin reductase (NADPH)